MSPRAYAVGAISIAVMSLTACGRTAPEPVVARVGAVPITASTLGHWASVLTSGRRATDSPSQRPQRGALDFLISSQWLIGEAADEGMAVSNEQVARQLRARIESYANGEAEFLQALRLRGETVADVMFEIELELASARIHRTLVSREHEITETQVAAYYSRHMQSFVAAEVRQVEITSRESNALAQRVKQEVASGRSMATQLDGMSLAYTRKPPRNALEKEIYTAMPHVLTGPVAVGPNHFVFEVRQITPARQRTLAQVRRQIEAQLAAAQRRRDLIDFVKAWEEKWIARTSCSRGFVVQKCRQYSPTKTRSPEIPASLQ